METMGFPRVKEYACWSCYCQCSGLESVLLKVDYEKHVSLYLGVFLYKMMERLGFFETWIGWMRTCLSMGAPQMNLFIKRVKAR